MVIITEKEINGEMLTEDALIREHEGLVHKICHKYMGRALSNGMDYGDILSTGLIGLLKAFRNFDGKKFPVRFSTYAVPMIQGEVLRSLRDQNVGIRYPRSAKEIAYRIKKEGIATDKAEEIAAVLNEPVEKINDALSFIANKFPANLDKAITESGEALAVFIGREEDYSSIYVEDFLSCLPENERLIVRRLMEGKTQKVIGDELGISQVQVSRLQTRLKEKLIQYQAHIA